MTITPANQKIEKTSKRKDTTDIPDCFGDFNKENKLCFEYCSISIRCCVLHSKYPKVDILEKLLSHNQYAIKQH